MRARPIMFGAPMVCALLAGKKAQTRRIVSRDLPSGFVCDGVVRPGVWQWVGLGAVQRRCPYGVVGDQLWVREAWRLDGWCETPEATVTYRADGAWVATRVLVSDYDVFAENESRRMEARGAVEDRRGYLALPEGVSPTWRPSIFMPRWASRITLEITDVRVQRLQDISEEDARAEGALHAREMAEARGATMTCEVPRARDAFRRLWQGIHGDGAWAANPWVWCLTFRRIDEDDRGAP